jgi:hypothetical protein
MIRVGDDGSTPVKRINDPDHLGDGEPRRIELSERRRAFNQSNLGPPHSRELNSGGALVFSGFRDLRPTRCWVWD